MDEKIRLKANKNELELEEHIKSIKGYAAGCRRSVLPFGLFGKR